MTKKITLVVVACLALIVLLLFINIKNHSKYKRQSTTTIDSLVQNSSNYTDEIKALSRLSDSLKNQIAILQSQVAAIDSVKDQFKKESSIVVEKLSKEKRVMQKKLTAFNRESTNFADEIRKLNDRITTLTKEIELLHSRHDIPILFILHSSLKYYYADSSEKAKIVEEFDRVSIVNRWQVTCRQIYSKVDKSSKSQYRSVKWAGEKAGCPFPASYLLIKEYGFDPEAIEKDEFLTLVKIAINSFQRDFQYCSKQVKTMFISEEGTIQRIKDTIICLMQNLEL